MPMSTILICKFYGFFGFFACRRGAGDESLRRAKFAENEIQNEMSRRGRVRAVTIES